MSLLVACPAFAGDDWLHWRGSGRADVVAEESHWDRGSWHPRKGVFGKPQWSSNVGLGTSSPLIVDQKVYVLGWRKNRDEVSCLDAGTGKQLWQVSYKSPMYGRRSKGDKGLYSGSTSTPEYDNQTGYLYTLGIDGDLNCWDTHTGGKRVWTFNLYDQYDVKQRPQIGRGNKLRDYGYTTSPLVYKDSLIVEVGDDEGNLMGFDKRTGQRLWTSESKDPAGHTGGLVPMTVQRVPCIAVLTVWNLLIVRLDRGHEGETVAQYEWKTEFANNIPTPVAYQNHVVITSAYNHYAICKLKITLKGATKVWEQPHASGVCSPIIYQGHLYWAWRGIHCLDFKTGKQKWQGGNVGTPGSCIVTSDGRMIVWANRGTLLLVETAERSPNRYTELARKSGIHSKDAWPHVAYSNGRLYCKDRNGNLKCFDLDRVTRSIAR